MKEKWKWYLVLALYGLVALLWVGRCASSMRYYGQIEFTQFFCAATWVGIFFIQFHRYRSRKTGDEE